jgi:hypothetical protein
MKAKNYPSISQTLKGKGLRLLVFENTKTARRQIQGQEAGRQGKEREEEGDGCVLSGGCRGFVQDIGALGRGRSLQLLIGLDLSLQERSWDPPPTPSLLFAKN